MSTSQIPSQASRRNSCSGVTGFSIMSGLAEEIWKRVTKEKTLFCTCFNERNELKKSGDYY